MRHADYLEFNSDRTNPGRLTITFNNPPINICRASSGQETQT